MAPFIVAVEGCAKKGKTQFAEKLRNALERLEGEQKMKVVYEHFPLRHQDPEIDAYLEGTSDLSPEEIAHAFNDQRKLYLETLPDDVDILIVNRWGYSGLFYDLLDRNDVHNYPDYKNDFVRADYVIMVCINKLMEASEFKYSDIIFGCSIMNAFKQDPDIVYSETLTDDLVQKMAEKLISLKEQS